MIRNIKIKDPENLPVLWWNEVEGLKGKEGFEFKPDGITIVWGHNGCGKSSLLKLLGRLFHCEQGGIPKVTKKSVLEFQRSVFEKPRPIKECVECAHDGQPVHFFDATSTPGISGGSLDDDFFMAGIVSSRARNLSAGQKIKLGLNRVCKSVLSSDDVKKSIDASACNDLWKNKIENALYIMSHPTEEKGTKTILMDEPTSNCDIISEIEFWETIPKLKKAQLIIATHSPFALWLEGAQYIDLVPGYLEKCRDKIKVWKDSKDV